MSHNDAPAPPNYQPIADASLAAAKVNQQTSADQLAWAKQTYADNKGLTDQVVNADVATQTQNNTNAAADRARYTSTFQPLEDQLASDASSYSSPERKDLEAGRAEASVAQQFQASRTNAARDLESFGINPSATRFAALDIGVRSQQAAATAAAGNQSNQLVDATGRALRSEAINVGRGYPGQIAGTYNTALSAGSGAVNGTLATTASGSNTMGSPVAWQGQSANNLAGATSALNTGYSNQMSQFNANQAQTNSTMGGIGGALGLGASLLMAADGGAVPEGINGTPGGAVPIAASPTGGRTVDDVPAALTAGEFVMPKQAVEWHGQKAMYAMIQKANEGRAEAKAKTGAVPVVRHAATQRPSAIQMQRAA